eukprot:13223583-Heterocapsa_arctica.AAC.1
MRGRGPTPNLKLKQCIKNLRVRVGLQPLNKDARPCSAGLNRRGQATERRVIELAQLWSAGVGGRFA